MSGGDSNKKGGGGGVQQKVQKLTNEGVLLFGIGG